MTGVNDYRWFLSDNSFGNDKTGHHSNTTKMKPLSLVLNLFSVIVYQAIAAPLYTKLFSVSDKQYRELLKERKAIILKRIFK